MKQKRQDADRRQGDRRTKDIPVKTSSVRQTLEEVESEETSCFPATFY